MTDTKSAPMSAERLNEIKETLAEADVYGTKWETYFKFQVSELLAELEIKDEEIKSLRTEIQSVRKATLEEAALFCEEATNSSIGKAYGKGIRSLLENNG